MLKAFPCGDWLPDIPPNGVKTLLTAKNVRVGPNGYGPVPSFSAITPALASSFQGGAAYVGSDGTASLLSATPAGLYRYSGGSWSSILALVTTAKWRFTQFGDNVICANGGQLVSYDLVLGTAAAIATAPTATDVATVRDFVVAIEPDGDELAVQWSAFNNSAGWTAGTDQSDIQPLLSGGKGVAVVGGEYGLILQRNAIKRMSYVGTPIIFQIDEISSEIGCMARGSVAQVGKLVGFLSERGFMLCDGNGVTPIGDEKFNKWFFDRFSREDIESGISAAVDPRYSLMLWAMPGSPGTVLAYNWVLDKATHWELSVSGLFTGFTANTSLDALDALYPSGLDSIPVSLDDPSFAGGNPLLLIANADYEIGAMAGESLEATIKQAFVEPSPGQRTRVRSVRPVTDATDLSVTLDCRARLGDAENLVSASSMRANGEMPIRANGRYISATQVIPAGATWEYAQGLEMFCEPAGLR